MARPAVLHADGPTGILDATLRFEVSVPMVDLARQNGTAIRQIIHGLSLATQTCDRGIVMIVGGVLKHESTSPVLHTRRTRWRSDRCHPP